MTQSNCIKMICHINNRCVFTARNEMASSPSLQFSLSSLSVFVFASRATDGVAC